MPNAELENVKQEYLIEDQEKDFRI